MKFFYFFLVLVSISLAGVSFYYTNIVDRNDTATPYTQNNKKDTPPPTEIMILREYGDISFKNNTEATYTPMTDDVTIISNYSSIKTNNGRGYLILPDNSSISLSTSTEITITYEETKTSIMQLLGTTYHRVTSQPSEKIYEVRTPNTLIIVRGTKLLVTNNPTNKTTIVAVTENSIEVTKTQESGSIASAPIIVQEGSLARIETATTTNDISTTTKKLKKPSSVTILENTDIPELQNLLAEHTLIDKEYDKATNDTGEDKRRQFMETVIEELRIHAQEEEQIPTNEIQSTSRIDEIKKVLKKMSPQSNTVSKAQNPLSTYTQPKQQPKQITKEVSPQEEITPTDRKETITTETNTSSPVYGGGASPSTTQTQNQDTKKLITFKPSDNPTPDEQLFIDTFYGAYEKYFLVSDATSFCAFILTTTPDANFKALLTISNNAGYILPRQQELKDFATDLATSCKDGSMQSKLKNFNTRFETVYPY